MNGEKMIHYKLEMKLYTLEFVLTGQTAPYYS